MNVPAEIVAAVEQDGRHASRVRAKAQRDSLPEVTHCAEAGCTTLIAPRYRGSLCGRHAKAQRER